MHLAGKADAFHLAAGDTGGGERLADGRDGGVPPVLRPLFRPQRAGHGHVFVRSGATGANHAAVVHQQGARAPGADIDSEPHSKKL